MPKDGYKAREKTINNKLVRCNGSGSRGGISIFYFYFIDTITHTHIAIIAIIAIIAKPKYQ